MSISRENRALEVPVLKVMPNGTVGFTQYKRYGKNNEIKCNNIPQVFLQEESDRESTPAKNCDPKAKSLEGE